MIRVAVKFCGHCNPLRDMMDVFGQLKEGLPHACVEPYLRMADADVLVILHGCRMECAEIPSFSGPVIQASPLRLDFQPVSGESLVPKLIDKIEGIRMEIVEGGNKQMNTRQSSDKRMSLKEAISHLKDGNSLAFSGMGGAQCVAQTYEIARQGQKHLTIIGDSPCECGDLLVGTGQIDRMEIAWCAYALAGLGYNFRRAVEQEIPHKIELEEYSNYTIGLRFLAGAINVPYLPSKSFLGSDLAKYNKSVKIEHDPFTNELVSLVPAARPDVAIVHVSKADKRGNAQIFGFSSNAENIARAAKYTIVTTEEIVETSEICRNSNLTIIPEYAVDAVVELPYACHPWNFPYAYAYDLPFHSQFIATIRKREGFEQWMQEWCYGVDDHEGYLKKVGYDRLDTLRRVERRFCKLDR